MDQRLHRESAEQPEIETWAWRPLSEECRESNPGLVKPNSPPELLGHGANHTVQKGALGRGPPMLSSSSFWVGDEDGSLTKHFRMLKV